MREATLNDAIAAPRALWFRLPTIAESPDHDKSVQNPLRYHDTSLKGMTITRVGIGGEERLGGGLAPIQYAEIKKGEEKRERDHFPVGRGLSGRFPRGRR